MAQGNATNHANRAAALGKTIIHYQRADGDYTGWGLHLWRDASDLTRSQTGPIPTPPREPMISG